MNSKEIDLEGPKVFSKQGKIGSMVWMNMISKSIPSYFILNILKNLSDKYSSKKES